MGEFRIPAKRIRTELQWLFYSFIFSFFLNIYSILKAKVALADMINSIHLLLLLTLVIYVLLIFVRGLASFILKISSTNRRDTD